MKYTPGQQVIVLDITHKPAGSAMVQAYHAETYRYTVLFQYPGTSAPESILIPEHRLVTIHLLAASAQSTFLQL